MDELNSLIADTSVANIAVADLIRRAKILAVRMKNKELLAFTNKELEGYERKSAPKYREVHGTVKAFNHVRGEWMPIQFPEETHRILSKMEARQPISQIDSLLSRENGSGYFAVPFSGGSLKDLQNAINLETRVEFHMDISELKKVAENIRNKLLDILLEIEVTGAGGHTSSDGVAGLRNEKINDALKTIGAHLPEMRSGMWAALKSDDPEAGRNAANLVRELIDQALKEGAPGDDKTRKQRAAELIKKYRGTSASDKDLAVIEASADLIIAEQDKSLQLAHGRQSVHKRDARSAVQAGERILELLFGTD